MNQSQQEIEKNLTSQEILVSIGMPVYNGDRYLRQALDSILAQDYENFELIISDNASTDQTWEICVEYAAKDKRIRLEQNNTNLGAATNFNRVFELSTSDYFMWAAHDDLWDKTYISKCLKTLQNHPECVLCCSEVTFIDAEGNKNAEWTHFCKNRETVGMEIPQRINHLIAQINWYEIYGIIRSHSLKKTKLTSNNYGSDVILLLELLLLGNFVKVPEALFYYRILPKSAQEQMSNIDPNKAENYALKAPYSFLARELFRKVLDSNLNESVKRQIKFDFIETICSPISQFNFLTLIFMEHQVSGNYFKSFQELRRFIENIITSNPDVDGLSIKFKPINISYDISVIGLGHHYPHARTGVFRVVEKIAYGLIDSPKCNLSLYSNYSQEVIDFCKQYRSSNAKLSQVPFNHKINLDNIDIFHSPFYPLKVDYKNIINFLTIYDLIPILYPHFFQKNETSLQKQALANLEEDDWIICISHSTKHDLCNYTKNIDSNKVFVTHLAADPEIFYCCNNQNKFLAIKNKYGIPESPYILSLSTLEPRKNVDQVIRCFAKIVKQENIKDLNLVLVGAKGWNYEKIFQEINNHAEIKDRIIITGYVADEDLAALYSNAMAFIYTSFYEGFGLPPLEAMQCGIPVITSNTSSLPEVVGDAGIMVDPTDTDALCHSIWEIYNQPSLRERMSIKSLEQAKKFSWEKCIQETIAAYSAAMSYRDLRVNQSQFDLPLPKSVIREEQSSIMPIKIIVDGIFFQLNNTGIARVWKSLLEEWVINGFAKYIIILDRAGTAPKISGIKYRTVSAYDYNNTDADRKMLQQVCEAEGADLFISTYYTTPISTPSVMMVYDLIPEVMGWEPDHPYWKGKHHAIQSASAYIAISENTARDLVKFFPDIVLDSITVAYCAVTANFAPASLTDINSFRTKYGITKPYFLLVGTDGYQNYKNKILFFQAFAQLSTKQAFDLVCTGSGGFLADNLRNYTFGSTVHMLQLDDQELRVAYSGAAALVYPSKYEGFGLPVLEALACGCPVITCPNASIPEVAGEAALYVNDHDVDGLAIALCEVQKPNIRKSLMAAGLEQAQKFSWSNMANKVSSALINATILHLKLKEINLIIFPDWSQPEEILAEELAAVIRAIANHPNKNQITLLIDTTNVSQEDANLILASVAMGLFMEEDLDVTDQLEISFIGDLATIQWETLLPQVQARIVLDHENQQALDVLTICNTITKLANIPAYSLEDLSEIKANNRKLINSSNIIIKSAGSDKPRIDVVLQSCGLHGWNLWRGWVNVLEKAGLLNRVFAPTADWAAPEPNDDDGLFEYLKNPEADVMLLLGFDWHSQALHNTAKWQNQWQQSPIKKVAILQECYSAEVVQNTPQWQQQLAQALATTIPCVDALVCNHEPDVQFLQEQANVSLPMIFLPFAIDPDFFKIKIPFNQRLNRAAFRGNISAYFSQETYQDRRQFIELLKQCGNVDLFEFQYHSSDPKEFATQDGVESYADRLNAYRIQLNLPSISATFTNRPFEVMACGAVLVQNTILGEASNQLFQDGQHLVYYDSNNPEDLINKINHLVANPDVAYQIAQQGYQLCYQKHTIANRIQSILEFLGIEFEVKTADAQSGML